MSKYRRLVLSILTCGIVWGTIATVEAGPFFGRWRQRYRYQAYSYGPGYQSYSYNPAYYGNTGNGYSGSVTTGYRGVQGVMGGNTYDPNTNRYDTSDHDGYYGYGF